MIPTSPIENTPSALPADPWIIDKLMSPEQWTLRRRHLKQQNKRLVLTNGCFDLLHPGHVHFLREAARQGDVLWVGVNSDASVRALKGPTRPIFPQEARLYLLNALRWVDGLFVFHLPHLAEEIERMAPDVYVKAGDYSLATLRAEEKKALEKTHGQILFLQFIPGWSTSSLVERLGTRG
jgi:rfaE bifunctional protein nucleotidyltransferase chain/domain